MRYSGLIGGVLKFIGGLIIYFSGIFDIIESSLLTMKRRVSMSVSIDEALVAIDAEASRLRAEVGEMIPYVGPALLLWLIGQLLLASAWSSYMSSWPWRARLIYRILVLSVSALLLLATLYVFAPFLGASDYIDAITSITGLRFASLLPYVYPLPLLLPIARGLIALFAASKGWTDRLSSILIMTGGIVYAIGAYSAYLALREADSLRSEMASLISGELTEEDAINALSLVAGIFAAIVMRVELIVLSAAIASAIYALGLYLYGARGKGGAAAGI